MARTILVERGMGTEFRITVEDEDKLTFAPFSPPKGEAGWARSAQAVGTLRVYRGSEKNIIAVFSDVTSFRDVSIQYSERVAVEEGATIWKSDQNGYEREEKRSVTHQWTDDETPLLDEPTAPSVKSSAKRARGTGK